MAKNVDKMIDPDIHFLRHKDGFSELDWETVFSTPFELTTPVQAMQLEARARSCQVVIMAALVPNSEFYDFPNESEDLLPDGQPTPTD